MGLTTRNALYKSRRCAVGQSILSLTPGHFLNLRGRNRCAGQISCILWLIAIALFSACVVPVTQAASTQAVTGGAQPEPPATDYLAFFNKRFGRGVTALNNAAVPVLILNRPSSLRVSYEKFNGKTWMPAPLPDGEIRFCQALGITKADLRGPVYGDYIQFAAMLRHGLRDGAKPGAGFVAPVPGYITGRFMEKPWKYKPNPWIQIWLRKQKPAFRVLVAASHRPKFFIPLLPVHVGGHYSISMVSNLDSRAGLVQSMCEDLVARAMMELGEKHIRRCQRDLLAAHRFAILMTQEYTGLAIMGGFSLAANVMDGERTLAASGELSAPAALRLLKKIQALPAPVTFAQSDDTIGRWHMLSSLQFLAKHPSLRSQAFKEGPWAKITQKWTSQQYQVAIPAFNNLMDQMVEIDRIKNPTRQIQRLAAMLRAWRKSADPYQNAFAAIHSGPVNGYMFEEIDEFAADSRVTRICMAIAAFKSSHGYFPARLNQLVPEYFIRVPRNPFTGMPFVYSASTKKCKITSYETFSPTVIGGINMFRLPSLIVQMHAR